MTMRFLSLAIIALFVVSCASTEQADAQRRKKKDSRPAWIDNPGNTFDEKKFLLAVGSGDTQQTAQNSALGNLSRIFTAEVKAEQQLIEEIQETSSSSGPSTFDRTEQLLNNTRIGSESKLINTQVLETYLDNGIYYAVAGMERAPTASIYRQEIDKNYSYAKQNIENAETAESRLGTLRYLKSALTLCRANDNLKSQLSIIRGMGMSDPFDNETCSNIEQRYNRAKENSPVKINMDGSNENIYNAVAEAFQSAGFLVSDDANPVIEAMVIFNTQEMDLGREGFEFAKWELNIQFNDLETGKSVQTYIEEGRDGAKSYDAAVIRAEFSARKMIDKNLSKFVRNEFLKIN